MTLYPNIYSGMPSPPMVMVFMGRGTVLENCTLLRVKPKLPDAKIGSHRFPDATGGIDNGFSLCTVPAFCHGPGILNICRYMHVPQVAGRS